MNASDVAVMVDRAERGWMVRVIGSVTVQCFSCASEEMALRFAAVFSRALDTAVQAA